MWVRIEDTFYTHVKTNGLSKAAIGLHMLALSMTCHQQLDGVVPAHFVKGNLKLAEALVLAKMWERHPQGFLIHDFLKYNPSREEILSKRKADRIRKESLAIPQGIQADSAGRVAVEKTKTRAEQNSRRVYDLADRAQEIERTLAEGSSDLRDFLSPHRSD